MMEGLVFKQPAAMVFLIVQKGRRSSMSSTVTSILLPTSKVNHSQPDDRHFISSGWPQAAAACLSRNTGFLGAFAESCQAKRDRP